MCEQCEDEVAAAREPLDALISTERQVRKLLKGETEAQHAIRLACAIMDGYHESGHDAQALALGFSLAIQKLLAVQEIYGIPTV